MLFFAANYLDIKGLLDLTTEAIASMIRGKTPDEICKTFTPQVSMRILFLFEIIKFLTISVTWQGIVVIYKFLFQNKHTFPQLFAGEKIWNENNAEQEEIRAADTTTLLTKNVKATP